MKAYTIRNYLKRNPVTNYLQGHFCFKMDMVPNIMRNVNKSSYLKKRSSAYDPIRMDTTIYNLNGSSLYRTNLKLSLFVAM